MIRLVGLMMAVLPATVLAVTPINGSAPTLTPVTINNGSGDQYDPHVSGDFAAYTSDLSIRYYRFSTGIDDGIPLGPSARDLLSDISGGKIVFSRVITGVKTAVMVFDSTTAAAPIEIDPANATRIGSAIGGNTVAYVDFTLEGHGELVIHDLVTSTSTRITNDTALDANPSVSPDGTVVTWEHCATSAANCDIWQAVKAGAVWNVGVASDSVNHEANPDTNGALVVYDSLRGGNSDLFWRPVASGAEVQLQMAGVEANPSIAGNFIAFESRPSLFDTSDIFVYDITTNRLYQITNTPLVTEQLNDITLLGNGYVRVVWASDEDGFDQRNVKGATFYLGEQNACLARTVVLDASKTYCPVAYNDAAATMTPAMKFKIPASVSVTAGNAGNGTVTFTYKNGTAATVTCTYKSGSNQPHPTTATELAKASKYNFHSCNAQGTCNDPEAGDEVTATNVTLHVNNGDSNKPSTQVRMTLNEVCPAAPAPPPPPKPKHGHGKDNVAICHKPPGNPGNAHTLNVSSSAVAAHLAHGDSLGACGHGHDDDDDDGDHDDDHHGHGHHGHHHDDLSQAPDAKQGPMGCASAGGAPAVFLILAVGAWLMLGRRRSAQKAVVFARRR